MLQQIKKIIIVGLSTTILMGAQALAVTPSPQMIEQFKQLPKSEQTRLAKQYGIDPAMLSGAQSQTQVVNPEVVGTRNINGVNSDTDQKMAKSEFDFSNNAHLHTTPKLGGFCA